PPAVGGGDDGGVDGRAGQGGVAGGADVPLDATGEPGPVEREVGGLQHRVAVQQFPAGGPVDEGGDPAAQTGQHGGPQPVVLDHQRVDAGRVAASAVAVPDADGQQAVQGGVADLPGHVARQVLLVAVLDAVHLVEGPQRGQGVVGTHRGRGQRQYLTS